MTIRIGSMQQEWANSDIVYTAIGMSVTDNASSPNSKLINLAVDGNSKFSITKDGIFRITPDLPGNSNISLFNIVNSGEQLIDITPNTVHSAINVVLEGQTTYVRSYAEGLQYINLGSNTELTLDLGVASTFVVEQYYTGSTGSLSKIQFVKPNTIIDDFLRTYSCSVLFRGNIAIPDTVWSNANVWWPGGFGYSALANASILTFVNTTMATYSQSGEWPSNTWMAINSGREFRPV